ncbi:LytTR family transcriptional regulator DNA-binding domain-containing protein [Flavobacterium sp. H122]|uniref:LytTR family transcriptional regulator DNA-binding domain-containing protein n=1 Tax=Flavobacterium sp. H122 TaxID=2529860 RepID=UPI0020BDE087|nr:LytTR family transcriptional regulator DNA-binding domain-containing protein [Flavobacterium sp. H122]
MKDKRYTTFFLKSIASNLKGELFLSNNESIIKIDRKGVISIIKGRTLDKNGKAVLDKRSKFIKTKRINSNQSINYLSATESSIFLQPYCSAMHRGIVNVSQKVKLVVTDSAVYLHKKGSLPKKINFKNHEPLEAGAYGDNFFWIGFRGKGAKVFDFEGNVKKSFLENHSPTKVLKDCFGGLWVTTIDSGVFYMSSNQIDTFIFDNSGINSLTSDPFGNVYIGTFNGDIYKKTKGNNFKKIHKGVINTPSHVQYFEQKRATYFFTDNKVFSSLGYQNKNFHGVLKISDDNPNALVSSQYGIYTLFENDKLISDTLNFRIHDISFNNGRYYLGTIDGLRVFGKNKIYHKTIPRLNCRIDDLDYEASSGLFYMATLGEGVLVYNPRYNSVYAINKKKGLSNDLVTEVYVEDKNTIWACTNYGLNRIHFTDPKTFSVEYITSSNGLLGNQLKDIEVIGDKIYVGTSKGLSILSKSQFEKIFEQKKYFLRLKRAVINNVIYNQFLNDSELKHNQNQIDFFIEAVSFSDNKNLVYKYKIEGLDKVWRYTKERKISYEFLPSGNYKFMVQIVEGGRILSNDKLNISFSVNLPFWETWWFISLVVLAIAGLIFLFFKIKVFTYNQDIVRELLRLWMRKIKKREKYYVFKEAGKEIRINTVDILFVKSSGNYIDIHTIQKKYTVREKISDFINEISDPLEFLRVHRSYIVRIDKVEQKSKKHIWINHIEIPIGETYLDDLDKIVF